MSSADRRPPGVRPTKGPIDQVTRCADNRLARLRELCVGLTLPPTPPQRRLISYTVVEAANLWSTYSRCFFISAALGARDSTGQIIVAAAVRTPADAEDLAVHALHPKLRAKSGPWSRRDQPDWQNKGHMLKALNYVGASVYGSVDQAVSYPTRVLSDLPTMRNFYAHKAERAADPARKLGRHYGITRRLSPPDLLCSVPKSGGDVLLNEWLADLSAIIQLMP